MHTPQVTPDECFEDPEEGDEPEDEDLDDGPEECSACAGTGEGQYDGTRCTVCGGRGVRKAKPDPDDFDPPEDDFKPWDGPL